MRSQSLSPAGLALLSLTVGAWTLSAQDNIVWQIGHFDHTSAEFGGSVGNQPVVVDLDSPDSAKRWPASQSGTLNAASSAQSHSRVIRFRMSEVPQGSFALDLAIMAGNPRVPRLEFELNGTPASAYLDRRLSYHAEGRADSPICSEARERIPVPASALRQRRQRTAHHHRGRRTGRKRRFANRLGCAGAAAFRPARRDPGISVEPTYFFTNQNGVLRELVAVTVAPAGRFSAERCT